MKINTVILGCKNSFLKLKEVFLDFELVGLWVTAELVTESRERALLGPQAPAVRLVTEGLPVSTGIQDTDSVNVHHLC